MTQRPHPDDPPRTGDELLTEREDPETTGVEPSDAPASEAERTEADPSLTGPAAGAGSRLSTPVASDELPYVDDRLSKLFVGAMVAVFTAIFAYGLLFGGAGLLTPDATPRPSRPPSPSVSPAVSPSGSPASSPSASPSPEGSPESSPSASPAQSQSASPGANTTASPGTSPSASPAATPSASPASSPVPGSPTPGGS